MPTVTHPMQKSKYNTDKSLRGKEEGRKTGADIDAYRNYTQEINIILSLFVSSAPNKVIGIYCFL